MRPGTLTIEAHIVVGEDGRAVPLGGAPDHHVQEAVGRLNVVLLGRETGRCSGSPAPGSSGERAGGSRELPGLRSGLQAPRGGTSHLTTEAEDQQASTLPGAGVRHRDNGRESPGPLRKLAGAGAAAAQALLHAASGTALPLPPRPGPTLTCSSPTRNLGLLLRCPQSSVTTPNDQGRLQRPHCRLLLQPFLPP